MGLKKKKKEYAENIYQGDAYVPDVAYEEPAPIEGNLVYEPPCSSWCFLMGAGFQASCHKPIGHEGEHEVVVNLVVEPRAIFTINWHLVD